MPEIRVRRDWVGTHHNRALPESLAAAAMTRPTWPPPPGDDRQRTPVASRLPLRRPRSASRPAARAAIATTSAMIASVLPLSSSPPDSAAAVGCSSAAGSDAPPSGCAAASFTRGAGCSESGEPIQRTTSPLLYVCTALNVNRRACLVRHGQREPKVLELTRPDVSELPFDRHENRFVEEVELAS